MCEMKTVWLKCILSLFVGSLLLPAGHAPRGSLFVIGGALKSDNEAVYSEMIRLAGGADKAVLGIIAAASASVVKTAGDISADFQRYGLKAERIRLLPIALVDDPTTADFDESNWARNAFSRETAQLIQSCTLIFFSGGDQARYRQTLLDEKGLDSPVLKAIRERYSQGAVVAGTSAGAAVMSDPMIISGTSLTALTGTGENPLVWDKGFALLPDVIVDQHFLKRGRFGRLLSLLLKGHPEKSRTLGLGIDEDTALEVRDGLARVIGRSGVLVIDTAHRKPGLGQGKSPIEGIRLHYLHQGDAFSLTNGEFRVSEIRKPIEDDKTYHERYPSSSDIFGRDTLVELITLGLADCRQKEIFGLAFDAQARGSVSGVRIRLYKTDETRAYLGKQNGEYTYTVLNIGLSSEAIRVTISTDHQQR